MEFRIKEICKKKGITITELAEKMDIPRENISKLSSGNPTVKTLLKVADALEVELAELFPNNKVTGSVRIGGETRAIDSVDDIEQLLKELKGKQ